MMNPLDPDYKELHDCMYAFLSAEEILEKYTANPNFVAICQRILKREWDTLKMRHQRRLGAAIGQRAARLG